MYSYFLNCWHLSNFLSHYFEKRHHVVLVYLSLANNFKIPEIVPCTDVGHKVTSPTCNLPRYTIGQVLPSVRQAPPVRDSTITIPFPLYIPFTKLHIYSFPHPLIVSF